MERQQMMAFGEKKKKKKEEKAQEKSQCLFFFFFLIWDKNHMKTGNKQATLDKAGVSQKIKHTHTTECFAISAQFKAPFSTFFPSTPPLSSPVTPPPAFAIMLTDSADILWAADRYVISRGETGLSSAGEYATPSSSRVDRHAWHFSTLSPW